MGDSEKKNGCAIALPEGFTVTAHSGCLGFPDNSLEAMAAGVEAGAGIVEFDLRFLEDGVPVLSHDAPGGGVVTLAEAFAFLAAHPGVGANVDVKSTAFLERVPVLAREYGVLDRIFFTGVEARSVDAVREKAPEVPYYLNADVRSFADADALADEILRLGAVGLNTHYRQVDRRVAQGLRRRGLPVSVWTVNHPMAIRSVLRLGVDNVTSRRPDLVFRALRRMQG